MDSLISLIIFLVLLTLGYFIGRRREKRHYQSILEREKEYADMIILHEKKPPPGTSIPYVLVTGSVVVSSDYFKTFIAGLRNLVGGRVSAYESLLDRARREAILRMKEQARALRCNTVANVRIVTTSLSQGGKNQLGTVEVLAYGTAMVFILEANKPASPVRLGAQSKPVAKRL